MSKRPRMTASQIESQYRERFPVAETFRDLMARELNSLVTNRKIALASPIESRIKELASIQQKLESLGIASVADIYDFVGLRIVVLFQRDLQAIHDELTKRFDIRKHEDTGERLSVSQFGYKSVHYIVGVRATWLELPSWQNMSDQHCEIQVRTMAQHIWAAASHKLQYKSELAVPPSVRRAINRVSALLETVDLEFERVLNDRDDYRGEITELDEPLNVENVQQILDQTFPILNKDDDGQEDYASLLSDLLNFGKNTVRNLKELLSKDYVAYAMKKEAEAVAKYRGFMSPDDAERRARGVYFTHVGLARWCIDKEFGSEWYEYNNRKYKAKTDSGSGQLTE